MDTRCSRSADKLEWDLFSAYAGLFGVYKKYETSVVFFPYYFLVYCAVAFQSRIPRIYKHFVKWTIFNIDLENFNYWKKFLLGNVSEMKQKLKILPNLRLKLRKIMLCRIIIIKYPSYFLRVILCFSTSNFIVKGTSIILRHKLNVVPRVREYFTPNQNYFYRICM